MTPAQIEGIWGQYAVRYDYDLAGRRISATDQNGHVRSEERRVGKECRSRWSADHEKKKHRRHSTILHCSKTSGCRTTHFSVVRAHTRLVFTAVALYVIPDPRHPSHLPHCCS